MSREKLSFQKPATADRLEQLRRSGCEIREHSGGRCLVARDGCGAVLGRSAAGELQIVERPGLLRQERIAHLLDRGFQKFWQDGDRRIPARAEELKALHALESDVRAALGIQTLYNEALGTVSSKYTYDRVEGREPGKRHGSFD
jgi:hypothetical protein